MEVNIYFDEVSKDKTIAYCIAVNTPVKSDRWDKFDLKSHYKFDKYAETCISHRKCSCKHIRGSPKTVN